MRRLGSRLAIALIVIAAASIGILAFRSGGSSPAPAPTARQTNRSITFLGAGSLPLQGTLLLPPGTITSKAVPGVLIVPDVGAVNRDGLTPLGEMADPLYSDLAQSLAAQGIASLRYDPRGAVDGNGQVSSLPSGTSLRYEDLVGDAQAGLKFLADQAAVTRGSVAMIGDGVGGLVALSAAASGSEGAAVARAVVLVSTPGRPVIDSMSDQLRAEAPTSADGQAAASQLVDAAAALAGGAPLPDPTQLTTALRTILAPGQQTYLKTLFSLDPAALARQVRVPALIVRGADDAALSAEDDQALAAALGTDARVLVAPQASRTLTVSLAPGSGPTTTAHAPTMDDLHNPVGAASVRDRATVDAITSWLATNLVASQTGAAHP